jgi:hypothetical protein
MKPTTRMKTRARLSDQTTQTNLHKHITIWRVPQHKSEYHITIEYLGLVVARAFRFPPLRGKVTSAATPVWHEADTSAAEDLLRRYGSAKKPLRRGGREAEGGGLLILQTDQSVTASSGGI